MTDIVTGNQIDIAAFDSGMSSPLLGSRAADWVEDRGRDVVRGLQRASQDQEGIGDDILRGAGSVLQGAGAVMNAPGIKQAMQVLDAGSYYGGRLGGNLAKSIGVDPRIGGLAGNLVGDAVTGGLIRKAPKIAGKLSDQAASFAAKNIPAQAVYADSSSLAQQAARRSDGISLESWQSPNRTPASRGSGVNQKLKDAANTPEGIKRTQEALDYRVEHGTLEGFKKTTTPWMLPDGDEVLFKKTKSGVKKALRSQKSASTQSRTLKEFTQTYGKPDWDKVMPNYLDPKDLPLERLEGHHKHMIDGYDWAFTDLPRKESQKIAKHFFDKKTPLGKTQFNRNNLPQPVHKALHSWMDKQMGLNGLDMPSLKGMSVDKRIAHLEVYMDYIQPVMDEATFILMRRYKQLGNKVDWAKGGSYKNLYTKGVKMIDQFTDAQNPYKQAR